VWLVHAGLDPRWSDLDEIAARTVLGPHGDEWLTSEEVTFAVNVRCCTSDGTRSSHTGPPGACPPPFKPWDELYRGESLVVHGHWARRGRYRGPRTLGLDSGCVHGGELTAWCQEEDRLEHVPARSSGRGPERVFLGS
jgi:bis(5'-nucleosyl)-tetraphosphatase (symmetrical)